MEDKAQSGIKDTVGSLQESTGTKEATQGASEGLDHTADAAKGTARDVEDTAQKNAGDITGGATPAGKGLTGDNKTEDAKEGASYVGKGVQNTVTGAGSSAYEGAKAGGSGLAETGQGVADGISSGVSKLGLGGSKE